MNGSSTCVCDHLRQGPVYDYSMNREVPQVNVYHYRRPEDVGFVKYLSETNVYHYRRRENDYFHYITRTSTSSTSYRTRTAPKRTLRRYNPETTSANECMCVV